MLCPHGGDRVLVHGESRHVVGYLRDFLFRDEQARQPVKALSGGERNRLLLAKILAQPANLLILDEPTNDLDIETLDLLEEMLADHPGTLLLVSHDRDFVDRLVTSTIVFEGAGRAREYAGGYSDWLRQRPAPPDTPAPPPRPAKAAGAGPRARVPRQAAARAGPPARPHRRARGRDRHAGGSTGRSRALRPRPGRVRAGRATSWPPCGPRSRRWRSAGWSWRRMREAEAG